MESAAATEVTGFSFVDRDGVERPIAFRIGIEAVSLDGKNWTVLDGPRRYTVYTGRAPDAVGEILDATAQEDRQATQ